MNTDRTMMPAEAVGVHRHSVQKWSVDENWMRVMQMHKTDLVQLRVVEKIGRLPTLPLSSLRTTSVLVRPMMTTLREQYVTTNKFPILTLIFVCPLFQRMRGDDQDARM